MKKRLLLLATVAIAAIMLPVGLMAQTFSNLKITTDKNGIKVGTLEILATDNDRSYNLHEDSQMLTVQKLVIKNKNNTPGGTAFVNVDGLPLLETISVSGAKYTNRIGLKRLSVSNCAILLSIACSYSLIEDVTATDCPLLEGIQASTSNLSETGVHISNCPDFKKIIANRAKFRDISSFTNFTNLQLNGGVRVEDGYTKIDEPNNVISSINHSQLSEDIYILLVRHNNLEKLNVNGRSKIQQLEANNNRLWVLNLDDLQQIKCTRALDETDPNAGYLFNVGNQQTFAEADIEKGEAVDGSQDKVKINIPLAEGVEMHADRVENLHLKRDDTKNVELNGNAETGYYFLISPKQGGFNADFNLKGDTIVYLYDTRAMTDATVTPHPESIHPAATLVEMYKDRRKMDVTAVLDPYIVYLNPATKSPADIVDYYSGTLYLDYDAIVPEGVEVYIVTGVKDADLLKKKGTAEAEAQLNLVKVGEAGDTIPALTALYVKSVELDGQKRAGMYAFHRTWEPHYIGWLKEDSLAYNKFTKIDPNTGLPYTNNKGITEAELEGNLLKGVLEDTTVPAKSVLTLGRQNISYGGPATHLIGFWPYTGTTIKAHRCYIPASALNGVVTNSAKGATFPFFSNENGTVTEIQNVEQKPVTTLREGWFTLQGTRLNGRPTTKGVYIHNGRTEIAK